MRQSTLGRGADYYYYYYYYYYYAARELIRCSASNNVIFLHCLNFIVV